MLRQRASMRCRQVFNDLTPDHLLPMHGADRALVVDRDFRRMSFNHAPRILQMDRDLHRRQGKSRWVVVQGGRL